WSNDFEDTIMNGAEIVHAILEIAHVAEEGWRRCGMTGEVCGNHDEEKSGCYWEHRKEIGVETDEGADCEKGESMDGVAPSEKTNKACLKDEDDTNATINIRPNDSARINTFRLTVN
ncbi:MAG: hypothetical protein Q9204_009174, partial [Flavoplaca sp. TL-2023a]